MHSMLVCNVVLPAALVVGFAPFPLPHDQRIDRIAIVAADDANAGRPVSLEIIAVFSDETVERLSSLTARQWFDTRDRLEAIDVVPVRSIRMPPGRCVEIGAPHFGSRQPAALLVFADYGAPGVHRSRIEIPDVAVELRRTGFNLTEYVRRHAEACGGSMGSRLVAAGVQSSQGITSCAFLGSRCSS